MKKSYDREKIMDCLFDPTVSSILSELESEGRDSDYLSRTLNLSEDEIRKHLSLLIEYGFVTEIKENFRHFFWVNRDKLAEVMEHDENFESTIEGLTKMDSFLN